MSYGDFKFSIYGTLSFYLYLFTNPYSITQTSEAVKAHTSTAGPGSPAKVRLSCTTSGC